jgi:DNA-binding MarR family transcriptional regulator
MSEVSAAVSAAQLEIEASFADLNALWDSHGPEIPEWVAQELTFGQMRLLFLLSRHGPSPISRIAEWLGVGMPAASGIVDRIERHGLVERHHRLDDRRVVDCQLTPAGRALIDEIVGMRSGVLRQMLQVLNEDELAQLARLISLITQRMRVSQDRT